VLGDWIEAELRAELVKSVRKVHEHLGLASSGAHRSAFRSVHPSCGCCWPELRGKL
jgi:hypothetical protein